MYLSSPRSKYSHRPEELIVAHKGIEGETGRFSDFYEKLKRSPYLKKKELAAVRESFREERIKHIRMTKT